MPAMTFHDYMRSYHDDHRHPVNKAIHMVGIPMIVASIPVTFVNPPVGAGLFATGWALQFVGHYIEGKPPAFARDLRYLAIGPVWAAVEWVDLLTGVKLYEPPPAATDAAATAAA